MDRYVKWNVQVIETEPLDIFAHPTWLPAPLDANYDTLWTVERMKPIIRALARTGTAVEIDSDFKVPRLPFLRMAKDAKLKFAFGSNTGSGSTPGLEFCLDMVKALGLKKADMFVPAPHPRKAIMRRKTEA
jgi:histidinol phosphatase-like PHP family hydrolase